MINRQHAEAGELLQRLLAVAPRDLIANLEYADCMIRAGNDEHDQALRRVVSLALRTNNIGVAIDRARQRVALAPAPAIEQRSSLVELLRRVGDHQEELSQGRELIQDLLSDGRFEEAIEILLRLVASDSNNAELTLQLTELYEALGEKRKALRFARHSISLLQQSEQIQRAKKTIQILRDLGREDEADQALDMLNQGEVINWKVMGRSDTTPDRSSIIDDVTESELLNKTEGTPQQYTSAFGLLSA